MAAFEMHNEQRELMEDPDLDEYLEESQGV